MAIDIVSPSSFGKLYGTKIPVGAAKKWFWLPWVFIMSFMFIAFAVTIDKGAYLHSDEFVILDLGRIILNPKTDWSIAWLADQEQPVYFLSYLGNVVQELCFNYGGQYGPRVSALLGALAAATALVGWLVKRGTSKKAAFLLGLVYLLDPLFVQSFTIGRLDSWVMTLCLLSCWVLRANHQYASKSRAFDFCLFFAGALAGIAFILWPSAIFLYPLIALELSNIPKRVGSVGKLAKMAPRTVLPFITGGVIAVLFLLLPIAPQLFLQLSNTLVSFKANMHSGSSSEGIAFFHNVIELLRVLKFSPFIVILAIIASIKERQLATVFSIGVVTTIMIFTLVYINRVQYLLPYFVVCISYLYKDEKVRSSARVLKIGALAVLLSWSVAMSLGVRTVLALDAQENRDRSLVYQAALLLVGPGGHRVYLPYDMYYAGRDLGWRMYRAYLAYNKPLTFEVLNKVLPHVDYIIMIEHHITVDVKKKLIMKGWQDKGVLEVYSKPAEPFTGVTTNEIRVRNLYSIFKKPYGPYRLYARVTSTSSSGSN